MLWQDSLVEGDVEPTLLASALAQVFGVSEADVEIVSDTEEATGRLCDRWPKGGQFSLLLSIYLRPFVAIPASDVAAMKLSKLLGRRLLFDGGTPSPFVMRLASDGTIRRVDIDIDAVRERDEYNLAE